MKPSSPSPALMTSIDELQRRRDGEAKRIRKALDSGHEERKESLKGGEEVVAFVHEKLCIGCDQCTLVCDDDAIEMYDKEMASPLMKTEINKKARILRDPCTGCRLCVLACPTDAIVMLDR